MQNVSLNDRIITLQETFEAEVPTGVQITRNVYSKEKYEFRKPTPRDSQEYQLIVAKLEGAKLHHWVHYRLLQIVTVKVKVRHLSFHCAYIQY